MLTPEQQSKVLALVDEYLEIRKRPDFDEQYKFDFFKKDHPDLVRSENLMDDWRTIKKEAKNLMPYDEMRMSLFTHLIIYHETKFKNLIKGLYDATEELGKRVDDFEAGVFEIVSNDPLWKNPKKMGFGASSFLLALNSKDDYLLMGVVKPFERFSKLIPVDLGKFETSGERYQKWNDFAKNDLIPLLRQRIPNAGMVECQDFMFSFRYLENPADGKIVDGAQYWLYRAEERWEEFRNQNFIDLGFSELWDLSQYATKDSLSAAFSNQYGKSKKNDELACFEFAHEMREGDIVIPTKGLRTYLWYGVVESWYRFDDTGGGRSVRKMRWLKTGEWTETGEETWLKQLVMKKLTNVTKYPEYVESLERLLEITAPSMNGYSQLNTILYWVPGTGKTHHSVNYALSIIEGVPLEGLAKEERSALNQRFKKYVDEGRVVFTTFHQSFSYEEFIEGLRASSEDGNVTYDVEDGIFKRICDEARKNWELSEKDDSKIREESLVRQRMLDFIDDSIEKWTIFKKTKGGDFSITAISGDKIVLYSKDAVQRNNEIKIKMDDLESLLLGESRVSGAEGISPFLGYKWRRQEDSYLWVFMNAISKVRSSASSEKIESADKSLKNYVLIVDEINRGNISKIFGELITLIEPTKRLGSSEAVELKLPYSKKLFGVPKNLFIIGTMNTADRSIALMDIALRRRFVFKEMLPEPSLLDEVKVGEIEIRRMFEAINERIEYLYDRDHRLGHAMFLPLKTEPSMAKLNEILLNGVLPLLQEYFYDDWEKIQIVLGDHPRQNFKQPRHRIVTSKPWKEEDVLWFDHDELSDEKVSYVVNTEISPESYVWIYKPAASNG